MKPGRPANTPEAVARRFAVVTAMDAALIVHVDGRPRQSRRGADKVSLLDAARRTERLFHAMGHGHYDGFTVKTILRTYRDAKPLQRPADAETDAPGYSDLPLTIRLAARILRASETEASSAQDVYEWYSVHLAQGGGPLLHPFAVAIAYSKRKRPQ